MFLVNLFTRSYELILYLQKLAWSFCFESSLEICMFERCMRGRFVAYIPIIGLAFMGFHVLTEFRFLHVYVTAIHRHVLGRIGERPPEEQILEFRRQCQMWNVDFLEDSFTDEGFCGWVVPGSRKTLGFEIYLGQWPTLQISYTGNIISGYIPLYVTVTLQYHLQAMLDRIPVHQVDFKTLDDVYLRSGTGSSNEVMTLRQYSYLP